MRISNIHQRCESLLDYAKDNGYSQGYITGLKREIEFIHQFSEENPPGTYEDYYLRVKSEVKSASTPERRRQVLGRIAQFDRFGIIPSKAKPFVFLKKDEFESLPEQFKRFISIYCGIMEKRSLALSTIKSRRGVLVKFLFYLTINEFFNLADITDTVVLDYFYDGINHIKGYDVVKIIKPAVVACINENADIKGLDNLKRYLPLLHKRHTVYQYLRDTEAEQILNVLISDTSNLSFRDRAIGLLFYYTGIRKGDVAMFKHEYIDWEACTITFYQSKNSTCSTIPLRPVIGNVIFDYVTQERPQCCSDYLFLTVDQPYRHLQGGSIYDVLDKIFKLAGVRADGGRKGTHIFRHHFTRRLIECKYDTRMITSLLGNTSISSIDAYLQSNFESLKSCALSIELYPLDIDTLWRK
jgi:site-specific recombinase XerD